MFTQSPDQAHDAIVPESHAPHQQQRAMLAFTITIAGIVAYVLLQVIAQMLPPHYSPLTQAISDLAVGPYGWLMAVMFLLYSVLTLAFLFGYIWGTSKEIRSRVGLIFLAIWAVLPGVLAFFPTDIVDAHGYPGSFQAIQLTTTLHGMLHIVLSLIAFSSSMLATLFISLRFKGVEQLRSLHMPALLIALLMWPTFLLTDTFAKLGFYGVGERLFVGLGLLWMLIVALWIRRRLAGDAGNRSVV